MVAEESNVALVSSARPPLCVGGPIDALLAISYASSLLDLGLLLLSFFRSFFFPWPLVLLLLSFLICDRHGDTYRGDGRYEIEA